MTKPYRLFGSELSPYSVKVRAYLRYKRIPHEWITRDRNNMAEFRARARLPLIPLLITPEDEALQDSTPILEKLEVLHPDPPIHPPDPVRRFLSALIEEYGDEWANKPMFHYRWTYPADQRSTAERIARENAPGASEEEIEGLIRMLIERMVPRLSFVGSSDETRGVIERSFRRQLRLLEAHLSSRPFLFGRRPVFADFGLALQLYECSSDPTPGALLASEAPHVLAWAQRMLDPKTEGELEAWEDLELTLLPFLTQEIGRLFLPWSAANARALEAGAAELEVTLDGERFRQPPQKYHARSLAVLRERYRSIGDRERLDGILERAGALEDLRG
ncbi:MAG: glutathione S-transferase family protein [Myxococcota bacterium]